MWIGDMFYRKLFGELHHYYIQPDNFLKRICLFIICLFLHIRLGFSDVFTRAKIYISLVIGAKI